MRISLGLKPLDLAAKGKSKEAEEKYAEHLEQKRADAEQEALRARIEKCAFLHEQQIKEDQLVPLT